MHSGTGFAALHPIPAFLYYVGLTVFVMLLFHPLFLTTALLMMLILWFILDKEGKKKNILLAYLAMGVIIVLLNPIFNRRGATILFYLFDQNVTLESIVYGLLMAIMLLTILFAFLSYNRVLTAPKIMYLFSSFVPRVALVLHISLRYVPLLLQRWARVKEIQRTQGLFMHRGAFKQKIRNGMQLFSILLSWSLEEAIETAQSMRARGYGLGKRKTFITFRLVRQDICILLFMFVLFSIIIYCWLAGAINYEIYPQLGSLALSLLGWLGYVAFCLFLFIPFYLEIKEFFLWRIWKPDNYLLPTLKGNGNHYKGFH